MGQPGHADMLEVTIRRAAVSGDYLTTRELAKALGIGESSVKRWANEGLVGVVRTVGGHRRIPLAEALRFAREVGLCAPMPDRTPVAATTGVAAEATERLHAALLKGDAEGAARAILAEHYLGRTVAEICDGPISESLARIGELWHGDAAGGIMAEHRATDICFDIVRRLQSLLVARTDRAHLAIGGAPDNDIYALPTLVASVVLTECGYAAVNLGASTPLAVLRRAIDEHRPQIAWIAMNAGTDAGTSASIASASRDLADTLATWNGFLVVGGRNVPAELVRSAPPNMRCLSSMKSLADFAMRLKTGAAPR